MTLRATVVVVNYNGAHLLGPCLSALATQDLGTDSFQVWVVDNASHDGSLELLARDFPDVRVLANSDNRGFAGGNNTALREVTTPFAVLVNNDAVPEKDWLRLLLEPFDGPDAASIGVTSGKVVFMPRFVRFRIETQGFTPGAHDTRELGVRVHAVEVDGERVEGHVLWERLTYGKEGGAYWWTRPHGELLIPVPETGAAEITLHWAAEAEKPVTLSWDGGSTTLTVPAHDPAAVSFTLPADAPRLDVVNNAGGVVLTNGYGADRGYQAIDDGRFAVPTDLFSACGNGMAIRSEVGHAVGWFDDDFFLYYEDTDLSWRIRARGWRIRYVPGALLRHHHSASSGEWSPVFVFHTDRNRLLMLTKDATLRFALREVPRYAVTTASMTLRALRAGLATKSRPPLRPQVARLRVIASYLRLFPAMVGKRRAIAKTSAVSRRELETLLVTHESWLAENTGGTG